jgi:hypothetical protein
VISDGRRIYLTGYSSITALQPYKYKTAIGPGVEAPAPAKDGRRQKGSPASK